MSSSTITRFKLASLLVFALAVSGLAQAGQAGEPADEDLATPEEAAEMATDDDLITDEKRVEESKGDVLIIEEVDETEETSDAEDTPKMMREADFPTPTRGMSKAGVRDAFGDPSAEHPPVGDPPITRWDYDRFSVFFEYDKVLHSVVTE